MLLSAVSVLVVAQSSTEIPEGLMNNSVQCWVAASCGSSASDVDQCTLWLRTTDSRGLSVLPSVQSVSPEAKHGNTGSYSECKAAGA